MTTKHEYDLAWWDCSGPTHFACDEAGEWTPHRFDPGFDVEDPKVIAVPHGEGVDVYVAYNEYLGVRNYDVHLAAMCDGASNFTELGQVPDPAGSYQQAGFGYEPGSSIQSFAFDGTNVHLVYVSKETIGGVSAFQPMDFRFLPDDACP